MPMLQTMKAAVVSSAQVMARFWAARPETEMTNQKIWHSVMMRRKPSALFLSEVLGCTERRVYLLRGERTREGTDVDTPI